MLDIKDKAHLEEMISRGKPLLLTFSADWCPDCRVIKPAMKNLEEKHGDKFLFCLIDRDNNMSLCEDYGITGIPSFVIVREGEAAASLISSKRKTYKEIEHFILES